MLRRNFLSFLSVSPLSFLIKNKEDTDKIIDIPEGTIIRTQKTGPDGVTIRYMLDGCSYSDETHPSYLFINNNGNKRCVWENVAGPNDIGEMSFDKANQSYHVVLRWTPGRGISYSVDFSLLTGRCLIVELDDTWNSSRRTLMNVAEFEQYIGITLEQFHLFN